MGNASIYRCTHSSMEQDLVDVLKRTNALYTDGHFVGTSGRHMSVYINKDALLPHTAETSRVGELFAAKNKDIPIDIVVGPAMGAIILAQWTAYHLSRLLGKEILAIYTDKTADNNQILKRGYDKLVAGKNILIVEDATTTGGSIAKVVESIRGAGGNVVQTCVMVNRDVEHVTSEAVGAPFSWLAAISAESFEEGECQMCKDGMPINTNVGHGKKYIEFKKIV